MICWPWDVDCSACATLRSPAQPVIDEHERHHRLAHRYEARQETGIVPAARGNFGRLAGARNRTLRLRQAAGRFDGNTAKDRLAAGDAAEHAAVPVGFRADVVALADEWIVVGVAASSGNVETRAILVSEHGRQR